MSDTLAVHRIVSIRSDVPNVNPSLLVSIRVTLTCACGWSTNAFRPEAMANHAAHVEREAGNAAAENHMIQLENALRRAKLDDARTHILGQIHAALADMAPAERESWLERLIQQIQAF